MSQLLAENDDGWDFKVLVVEGEWVVRIPRSELSVEKLRNEVELLPALAAALPVEIPRFSRSRASRGSSSTG